MAKTNQFTITIANKPGALLAITRPLGAAKVNLVAIMAMSHGTEATIQLVAEDAKKAKKALDGASISYQESAAQEYSLPNKAGALTQYLETLAAKGVNLSSLYATVADGAKKATIVYTAEAAAKATSA